MKRNSSILNFFSKKKSVDSTSTITSEPIENDNTDNQQVKTKILLCHQYFIFVLFAIFALFIFDFHLLGYTAMYFRMFR